LDLLHYRGDLDRAQKEPAAFVGKRLFWTCDHSPRASDEKDVDVIRFRQLTHALDDFEGSVGIGVHENDARPLHGDSSDEHRRGNVDDCVACGTECH
jgi:hypothetical protein